MTVQYVVQVKRGGNPDKWERLCWKHGPVYKDLKIARKDLEEAKLDYDGEEVLKPSSKHPGTIRRSKEYAQESMIIESRIMTRDLPDWEVLE